MDTQLPVEKYMLAIERFSESLKQLPTQSNDTGGRKAEDPISVSQAAES